MAVGDVHRAWFQWSNAQTGKNLTSGFHFIQEGLSVNDAEVHDAMEDWWTSQKTKHAANIVLDALHIRRVSPPEPIIRTRSLSPGVAGTASGEALPGETAPVISLRTASIGKSYRGRMYLPPVGEALSDGQLSTSTQDDIETYFETLMTTMASVGTLMPVVVYSDALNVATEVTHVLVDRRIRAQRRRQQRAPLYT